MKWLEKIKTQIASLVMWAEKNLKGKTGKEKRKAVLDILCEHVRFPGPLDWFRRPVLAIVVNKCIDRICAVLNIATDHEGFDDVEVDIGAIAELSRLPREALVESQDVVAETKQATVDERIAQLCEQYGIQKETPKTATTAVAKETAKSGYFQRSEFACKCGCGTNRVKQELIDTLNAVREELGVPVTVTSGTRCAKHNAAVGGVANSNHITGEAADIKCSQSASTVWSAVRSLWSKGKLPKLAGLGRYDTFTHLDIAPKATHLREWDERKKK